MATTYSTAPFNCSGYPKILLKADTGACHKYIWYNQVYTSTAADFFTRFPTKAPVRSAAPSVSISPTKYIHPAGPSNRYSTGALYVATAVYSDSACKIFYYASLQRLNTCHRSIDDENLYVYIMATDYTLTCWMYSDSLCKLRTNQTLTWYDYDECVGMTRISLTRSLTKDFVIPTAIIR